MNRVDDVNSMMLDAIKAVLAVLDEQASTTI